MKMSVITAAILAATMATSAMATVTVDLSTAASLEGAYTEIFNAENVANDRHRLSNTAEGYSGNARMNQSPHFLSDNLIVIVDPTTVNLLNATAGAITLSGDTFSLGAGTPGDTAMIGSVSGLDYNAINNSLRAHFLGMDSDGTAMTVGATWSIATNYGIGSGAPIGNALDQLANEHAALVANVAAFNAGTLEWATVDASATVVMDDITLVNGAIERLNEASDNIEEQRVTAVAAAQARQDAAIQNARDIASGN